MPLAMQQGSVAVGGSLQFNFPDLVQYCAVGMSGFTLTYPNNDCNDLQLVQLSLSCGSSGSTVTVNTTGQMQDADGDSMSATGSTVGVVVLAWLGTPAQVTMQRCNDVQAGGGVSVNLSSGNPAFNTMVMLAGFDIDYGSGNQHHLQQINASVDVASSSASTLLVSGSAGMQDASGDTVAGINVDAQVFVNSDPSLIPNPAAATQDLQVFELPHSVVSAPFPQYTFNPPVEHVAVVAKGFQMFCGDNKDFKITSIALSFTPMVPSSSWVGRLPAFLHQFSWLRKFSWLPLAFQSPGAKTSTVQMVGSAIVTNPYGAVSTPQQTWAGGYLIGFNDLPAPPPVLTTQT